MSAPTLVQPRLCLSVGWASLHILAQPGPFITRLPRGALPSGTYISREASSPGWGRGLGQWRLPPKSVEVIFFWSQGQLFEKVRDGHTPPNSIENLLSVYLLRILASREF